MTAPLQIDSAEGVHTRRAALMHTTFEVRAAGVEAEYAAQAGEAVFERIAEIERLLSFFNPCSEVARINAAPAGTATRVGPDCWRCIEAAYDAWSRSAGAFDPAVGAVSALWTGPQANPPDDRVDAASVLARAELFERDLDRHAIIKRAEGAMLDLSGVAKGYALDQARLILADWDISSALLIASGSTVLAMGAPPGEPGWQVRLHNPIAPGAPAATVTLSDWAVSGSSNTPAAGAPNIDPRTGRRTTQWRAGYVLDASAATADAMSTGLLAMDADAAEACWAPRGRSNAMLIGADGQVLRLGRWPNSGRE